MTRSWFTKRFIIVAAIAVVALIGVIVWLDATAPQHKFHSITAAGGIEGIEIIGFDWEGGKDANYLWHLRHPSEALPRMISALPFHPCDDADTRWLRVLFGKYFKVEHTLLATYTGYRGDNAHGDAQYILVSPDNQESFYLYIDF